MSAHRRWSRVRATLLLALGACAPAASSDAAAALGEDTAMAATLADPQVAMVLLRADGTVEYNRRPIAARALADSLAVHRRRSRAVLWYSREGGEAEPTPAQLALFEQVAAARLPVRLVEPGTPEARRMGLSR